MNYKLIFFFILLQISNVIHAQQYNFKNYTVQHGLGSASINHIFQDSKGYIWFATQNGGVSRFNGKTFKNYTKADGLINNDVTFIAEDNAGNLWFGTASGASQFNGTSFQNFQTSTSSTVFSIHIAADNTIWFATRNDGIKILNGKTFHSLTEKEGLPSNEVYTITYDVKGSYWIGTANGIAKYSNGKITDYSKHQLVKEKAFFSSFTDRENKIWLGASSGEVLVIQNDSINQLPLPEPFTHDFIGCITQDKQGNIWLAADHGLLKYNGTTFKQFSEREGFSANVAQTVMCDYEGNIWAGTLGSGAYLFKSEAWVHYAKKEGLTGKNIITIYPSTDEKTYYIGTNDGVFVFDPNFEIPFVRIKGNKTIEHLNVTSLSVIDYSEIWIGTQDAIYVLEKNGDSFRVKEEFREIAGEPIISPTRILDGPFGKIWIVTYGSGIFALDGSACAEVIEMPKAYNTKTGFASNNIITAFADSKSNLWLATQDAGLSKYDGKIFITVNDLFESEVTVWSMAEDKDGNIYFGTSESGLHRYDGKNIYQYNATNDGLSSDNIIALTWDTIENCLWAGSEKGLDKIKFTDDYKIERIQSYTEQDAINHHALVTDKSGAVLLGTINGLWLFNRHFETTESTAPKIQLTGIRLFYETADWIKYSDSIDATTQLPIKLELPYNKNHLTFDIQALTTQGVQYSFILEGSDEQWSTPILNNEITYSNISPGEYVFKAKAITSEGIASAETVSFSFIVHPPWWSTWWFQVAALFAASAALFIFIKTRERVLKEQNVKLEKTVKERTQVIEHQKAVVEQTLSEKETLLHEKEILLKEIHHRVKNNLQTISSILMLQSAGLKDEQAKKAIAESQSRVRSIALVHQKLYQTDGLEKVELSSFIKDLTVQVQSLYPSFTNRVSLRWSVPEIYILIDIAIPLGLILNELLTNSYKYAFNQAPNGTIDIIIDDITEDKNNKKRMKKLVLTYRDSGPGFATNLATGAAASLGLRLINLLSQQIGATLQYSNAKGSEYIFTFDLNI